MSEKKLVIIIINYNCADDTIECLNSLSQVNLENVFIFIVDNNSTDDSVIKLSRFFNSSSLDCYIVDSNLQYDLKIDKRDLSKYNFIKSDANLGFAGGNNLILKLISEDDTFEGKDNILLLNPDTIVSNSTLDDFSKVDKEHFIASCKVKSYEDPELTTSYGGYKVNKLFGLIRPSKKGEAPDYVYGGALFTNLRTINMLGYLPTEYFLYWEETDYCTYARKMDIPLILIDSTCIYDKVGQSIGRGMLANYYFVRNSFIYFRKYYPQSIIIIFLVNILRVFHKLIKTDFKSAKGMLNGLNDHLKSNYGYKDFS